MRFAVGMLAILAGVGACWSESTAVVAPPIVVPPQPPHVHVVQRGPYADLTGTWTGHGFQYDNNSDWDIELSFVPSAGIGEQVGTVEYPGLECGGVLIRRPEHDDGTLVVQERITHVANLAN